MVRVWKLLGFWTFGRTSFEILRSSSAKCISRGLETETLSFSSCLIVAIRSRNEAYVESDRLNQW